jgi:threonine dehydrogenase-like Zn-dependent dehydrogenase
MTPSLRRSELFGMSTRPGIIRAAVMRAPRELEVQEFPRPEPPDGAVLMRVTYSGVCGTDKHTYRGETKQYAGTSHERELEYPLICGHENVGLVEEVGAGGALDSEGRPLRPGDRIVPGANVPCGACYFCLNKFPYYYCENLADYGNSLNCKQPPYLFGGWAESMLLLPGTSIFRVPEELPDQIAVLAEPMAVTHGLDTARALAPALGSTPFAETVAVVGVGPLGLCHLIKARLLGCGKLIALDRLPSRLALAEEFGATLTLNVEETEPDERSARVREHTGGLGADIVADCSGVPETFPESLDMVRFGGIVVEAGAFVDLGTVAVNPTAQICTKNVGVIGVGGETSTSYLPAMRLMARNLDRLPFERIVTHRFGLADAQEALEVAQLDGAMKVLIDPQA